MSLLTVFILGLMRIAPIVSLSPFLGSKLPGGVKMGLTIALVLIFLPHIAQTTTIPVTFDILFLFLSVKEIFVGLILGVLATIPFYIAQSSGVFIDFMRGSSALQVTDPFMQTQTSPIGILLNYVMVVIFFQLGGPFLFFDAIFQSYNMIPVDHVIHSYFFASTQPFWKMIFGLLTRFLAVSLQLAAPSIVAILMAEMFLGIANRLAPQVQIVFLGMSLKSLLGLGLLWAGWFFILKQMGNQSILWLHDLEKVLQSMKM
ncbi:MAG TPA: flagellar biosynthetic protein FliR [Rhabdochlamydiaceae bacterium]|nr:flagellar biosynthetic protein FliR [Rhabdochlamydiaceae bacterium]